MQSEVLSQSEKAEALRAVVKIETSLERLDAINKELGDGIEKMKAHLFEVYGIEYGKGR